MHLLSDADNNTTTQPTAIGETSRTSKIALSYEVRS
eukprot:CAMPEP_0185209116 /NCGR_PEP_ID=MMETSP1140-20130426/63216_1 /TAXON_ID=298111 /ORGANISM="Pavlova sp., Strain CCMP459" /LENGTH=35 /DNA_ID= /DNA_START= /DNA_END= /DNA_ORIENTATION=